MIKKCALWLRDSFIRNRSLNATRIVAGSFAAIILIGALLLAGELSFLYFLGFLFAAARLYDPLGVLSLIHI